MKKIVALFCLCFVLFSSLFAQPFTHADTLRGSNGPGRSWWDATKYDLHVKFNLEDSSITGYNIIDFKVLKPDSILQIDLQQPLVIDSVVFYKTEMKNSGKVYLYEESLSDGREITRDGNAFFIKVPSIDDRRIAVYYHGKPRVAINPPWDGGFIWKRDKGGNPWIAVACQGIGASVWYPCKDYQGDEPDSAAMHFTAPSDLVTVSNGRLRSIKDDGKGYSTYTWAVVDPINNYDISFYIGKYVHWGEIYNGENGDLTMDYWVLDSNLAKAQVQFKDAPRMMKAFEYWFGPYPFYKDGYKLVDAPYLGMEHQSAIAYGNGYKNGYHGIDLSGSGWGLKWDFIIVHESGHEWFGNNITSKDIADMWIHEGFTNYSETLFTEYYYGKKAATDYIAGIRKNIRNDKPIIGPYGVNKEGSSDMYYKAANMIHMIRQIINNDEKFRQILWGLNKAFYHQTVTTGQIQDYINKKSGIDFSKVFDQYLRTTQIPELEYRFLRGKIYYRWSHCIEGFNMPLKIYNERGNLLFIYPTDKFKKVPDGVKSIKVDENFYVNVHKD